VKEDTVFSVKGRTYSFSEMITGKQQSSSTSEILNRLKNNTKNKLYSVIFYLNPGDYHRYHSPTDLVLKKRIHVLGELWLVSEKALKKHDRIYEGSERVSLFSRWEKGVMTLCFVGALNVGSITLDTDPELITNDPYNMKKVNVKHLDDVKVKKGDQLGMFKIGSTVVMFFEAPHDFVFTAEAGQKIRYGESFGYYNEEIKAENSVSSSENNKKE